MAVSVALLPLLLLVLVQAPAAVQGLRSRSYLPGDTGVVLDATGTVASCVTGKASGLAAWGYLNDDINGATGWATLEVHSNNSIDSSLQAYAAGFLEGCVSQQRMYEFLLNTRGLTSGFSAPLQSFVEANLAYIDQQVQANAAQDPYWYQVGLILTQAKGVFDGYQATAPANQTTDWMVFYGSLLQVRELEHAVHV